MGTEASPFCKLDSSVPSVFPSQPNDFKLNRDERPETFVRVSGELEENVKQDTRQAVGYFHSLDSLLRAAK